MEKVIKRGYVKWTDEDGVFHKELLSDHPELMADASAENLLHAEEARRLNAAAEDQIAAVAAQVKDTTEDDLAALKAAPEDVLTVDQLAADDKPEVLPLVDPTAPGTSEESSPVDPTVQSTPFMEDSHKE